MPAKVVIYTTDYCGYCGAAKKLLGAKGIPYEEINVSHDAEKRAWLRQTTGQYTTPQIFIDDRSIGGYVDLAALEKRGKLDKLAH